MLMLGAILSWSGACKGVNKQSGVVVVPQPRTRSSSDFIHAGPGSLLDFTPEQKQSKCIFQTNQAEQKNNNKQCRVEADHQSVRHWHPSHSILYIISPRPQQPRRPAEA